MLSNKRFLQFFIWSLVIGALIAIFWAVFYLITGYVPVVDKILMPYFGEVSLFFGISRWWDILLAPLYILAPLPTDNLADSKRANFVEGWIIVITVASLFLSFVASLWFGLVYCIYGVIPFIVLFIVVGRLPRKNLAEDA
jgi:hypothetical protein